MKRFEFSLNRLLDYKEQILRKEKNDLANLRRQQQQAIEEKEQLISNMKRSNQEYVINAQKGMSPQHIVLTKGYINSLSEQIRVLERSIIVFDKHIEKQLGVVVEATKEVSSLEKLQEKQLEEYNKELQKSEEIFITEYVTNSQFYR